MNDSLRVVTVFVCFFDVGCIGALYFRIGHSFLPKTWMRMLMIASTVWLLAGAIGTYERIGEAVTWRTPVAGGAALAELVAFLGLYHWYGTPEGKAHIKKVLEK